MMLEVAVEVERLRKIKLVVVVVEEEVATLLMVVAFTKVELVDGVKTVMLIVAGL